MTMFDTSTQPMTMFGAYKLKLRLFLAMNHICVVVVVVVHKERPHSKLFIHCCTFKQ